MICKWWVHLSAYAPHDISLAYIKAEHTKTYTQTLHHLVVCPSLQRGMTLPRFREVSCPDMKL